MLPLFCFSHIMSIMYSLLLVIIYIAFISLGLPDSLLGSAWPVMQQDLNAPLSYAGIVTMIIAGGTIVSSLFSDKLTQKLGTGAVTAVSVLLTALALFGFSLARSFWVLCVLAVPYGLGAGAVDAALNNYVALYYKSRHMSWLHCFWGIGAAVSPYIMGFCLTRGLGWSNGYLTVAVIQIVLTACLFISLPLWKKQGKAAAVKPESDSNEAQSAQPSDTESKPTEPQPLPPKSFRDKLKIKGLPFVMLSFFAYCAAESTAMLWASSYLTQGRGMDTEIAAMLASLFFLGITLGRFISGFISEKVGDKRLIRIGIATSLLGAALIAVPDKYNICAITGLVVTGLGCAPVYPSIIHATPDNFGKENSQSVIGMQMASAYTGSTFIPPLFGLLAQHVNIKLFPVFIFVFFVLNLIMNECLNKSLKKKKGLLTEQ